MKLRQILTMISGCSLLSLSAAEVWQEAEDYVRSNWSAKQVFCRKDGSGASNELLLKLYRSTPPDTKDGYFAEYEINVPENGTYHIWASISTPSASWASPFTIQFDDQPVIDVSNAKWKSTAFGGPHPDKVLGWLNPGSATLAKGKHKVVFRVTSPRKSGGYISYFDGFYLTTNPNLKPLGRYQISPRLQVSWNERLKKAGSYQQLLYDMERRLMKENLDKLASNEQITDDNAALVERKLMARPLPSKRRPSGMLHRFGLHGMEKPFVTAGIMPEKMERAFELLARAGVDSLRTAELCWHRLGKETPDKFDYKEIDYQVQFAKKYGMNFMFTIGYPAGKFTKNGHHLSTFRPQYEALFRDYLRRILPKYDKYAQYWEYCNEVDAPHVWWRGATPEEYVRDCRIVRQEMDRLGIRTPLMGISATYSRTPKHDSRQEGQAWTRRALAAGLEKYVDGYTLHYTWSLKQKGFVDFFRKLSPDSVSRKLSNSEESAYSHPGDVIKLFARDLYLYGFESVYYYVSRDWIEAGTVLYSGLFDIDWRPKLRLLSYALSADAMKNRNLAAMAEPVENVEAYLLEDPAKPDSCAVVLWKNGGPEEHGSRFKRVNVNVAPGKVEFPSGSVISAWDWKMESVKFNSAKPEFRIGTVPLVVYCTKLPDWKRISPAEWLRTHDIVGTSTGEANIPGK